jgi:hypothetical protein
MKSMPFRCTSVRPTVLLAGYFALAVLRQAPGQIAFTSPVSILPPTTQNEQYFGRSIDAGDVNGDGLLDLLIGAPGELGEPPDYIRQTQFGNAGAAYLCLALPSGGFATPQSVPDPSAPGLATNGYGHEVLLADVDGDGLADLFVSSPLDQSTGFPATGVVHYFPSSAPATSVPLQGGPPYVGAPVSDGQFGVALVYSELPSFNLPGPQITVGQAGLSSPSLVTTGVTWGFHWPGPPTTLPLTTFFTASELCPVMGSPGGFIPEPNFAGVIAATPPLANLTPGIPYAQAGLVFGIPFKSFPLVSPFPEVHISFGWGLGNAAAASASSSFGMAVAYDWIFADQYADPIVAAPYADEVLLFNGTLSGAFGTPLTVCVDSNSSLIDLPGAGPPLPAGNLGLFGKSLAVGDFDGDGFRDLAVGAPLASTGAGDEGAVHVYRGPPPYTSVTTLFGSGGFSGFSGDSFGWELVAKDLNGDGFDDLVVGAPGDETLPGTAESGRVMVFFSAKFFVRGDCNGDGKLDLSDAVALLVCLFLNGPCPSCDDAADVNDDGDKDISDAIYKLQYLFLGGSAPPLPFPACGVDPTTDSLGCGVFPPCTT